MSLAFGRRTARGRKGAAPMWWRLAILAMAAAVAGGARADDWSDCTAAGARDAVIAACSRAIDSGAGTDGNIAIALVSRGRALASGRDHAAALADFDRAIDLKPDFETLAAAHLGRGRALTDLRDYEGAVAALDEAIALRPEDAAAFTARAIAHEALRHWEQAVADYNRSLELDPSDGNPAHYYINIAYHRLHDSKVD